ncbi:hypothetical protein [Candidatus Anaplasma sp. TIGMIC]|uniref:hypothetical protein n=1 Tax=Candidatus Anaplasma sp. TIGMIC TaxID=3020713 RepID=UPI00232C3F81|nr:hypothetical protein [Candidatus Anaplasma sp. TIGMIC]MDB1135689.1 hypothetical protein [Candidatus Anaplasma sp. TIGMIC]
MIICAEINRNNSVISFSDEGCVEDFKRKFTTLDANTVSRAIFPYDVSIKYGTGNRVELLPSREFTYNSVANVVNHMVYYGFCFKDGVLSDVLKQACKLKVEGLVILTSAGVPTYAAGVDQDKILLSPIEDKYLDFDGSSSKKLEDLLRRESSMCDVIVDRRNRTINAVTNGNVSDALEAVIKIMVTVGAIEERDRRSFLKTLQELAFVDFTNSELRIVQNIANCPNAHPLSKYKVVAKSIESILSHLKSNTIDRDVAVMLEKALEGKDEFSTAPPVLMKSFNKLNKNFNMQLRDIIGGAHHQ